MRLISLRTLAPDSRALPCTGFMATDLRRTPHLRPSYPTPGRRAFAGLLQTDATFSTATVNAVTLSTHRIPATCPFTPNYGYLTLDIARLRDLCPAPVNGTLRRPVCVTGLFPALDPRRHWPFGAPDRDGLRLNRHLAGTLVRTHYAEPRHGHYRPR